MQYLNRTQVRTRMCQSSNMAIAIFLSSRRKLKWMLMSFVILMIFCKAMLRHDTELKSTSLKSILLWNKPMDRIEITVFGSGHEAFVKQRCKFTQCEIINSQWEQPERPLRSYDAVIFLFNNHDPKRLLNQVPLLKDQWDMERQRFIFFTQESPPYLKNFTARMRQSKQLFNWTMTYRRDSDVQLLYGRIKPLMNPLINYRKKKKKKKKKLVAWMVSHCETHGRREDYVKVLQRYVKGTFSSA